MPIVAVLPLWLGACAGTVASRSEVTSQDAADSFHRVEDAYRRVEQYEDTGTVRSLSVHGAEGSASFKTTFSRASGQLQFAYTGDSVGGTVLLTTLADGQVEVQDADGTKSTRTVDTALSELAGVTMATTRIVPILLRGGRLSSNADARVESLGLQVIEGENLHALTLQGRSDRRLTIWVDPTTNFIRRAELRALGQDGTASAPQVQITYRVSAMLPKIDPR